MKNKKFLSSIFILGAMLFWGAANVSAQVCGNDSILKPPSQWSTPITPNTPQCKAAKSAFDAATVIVTGVPDLQLAVDYKYYKDTGPYVWVNIMAKDSKYSGKFNDGLKLGDAVAFLKERVSKNSNDRLFAIDNAFREVYGRDSTAEEQAQWDAQVKAQKAWYAVIVTTEIGKLNADPNKRAMMIKAAYTKTHGYVSPDRLTYWGPRTEHFRLIANANRNSLYSSGGAVELTLTVKKAFLVKYGNAPSDKELKKALTLVTDQALIYEQMLRPEFSLK